MFCYLISVKPNENEMLTWKLAKILYFILSVFLFISIILFKFLFYSFFLSIYFK